MNQIKYLQTHPIFYRAQSIKELAQGSNSIQLSNRNKFLAVQGLELNHLYQMFVKTFLQLFSKGLENMSGMKKEKKKKTGPHKWYS